VLSAGAFAGRREATPTRKSKSIKVNPTKVNLTEDNKIEDNLKQPNQNQYNNQDNLIESNSK
jgi:hypothetical protein